MLRKPTGEEETQKLDRILMTSFAITSSWGQWMDRVGRENLRVFEDAGGVVGGAGFYRMAEWFGGRSVALVGIAGVGVAPESRGRGLAKKMCGDLLREIAAEGVPLAGLYASTASLYRAVGFEQAGTALAFRANTNALGKGSHDLPCREVDPRNWEIFKPLYDLRARSWTGHLDRTQAIWERTMTPRPGMLIYAYAVGEPMEGYVVIQQTPLETRWFDVRIRDCVFTTPAAAQRIIALLSDLRALARWVTWTGVASDPLVSLLPEQTQEVMGNERWMLRILDVERALEQRGWPPIAAEIHLRIRDRLLPANDGTFVLRVAHEGDRGTAKVERGGRGDVTMDIRALAAMYTGFAHPVAMKGAGLLDGDASMLATLFAGPEPWCCDHY